MISKEDVQDPPSLWVQHMPLCLATMQWCMRASLGGCRGTFSEYASVSICVREQQQNIKPERSQDERYHDVHEHHPCPRCP